jgi:hypothetical protein
MYSLDTIKKCELVNSKEMKKMKNNTFAWEGKFKAKISI